MVCTRRERCRSRAREGAAINFFISGGPISTMFAPLPSPVSAAVNDSSSSKASLPICMASSTTITTRVSAAAHRLSSCLNAANRWMVPANWRRMPKPGSNSCSTSSGGNLMRPIHATICSALLVSSARVTMVVLPTPAVPLTTMTESLAVRSFFRLVTILACCGPTKIAVPSAFARKGFPVRSKCCLYMLNGYSSDRAQSAHVSSSAQCAVHFRANHGVMSQNQHFRCDRAELGSNGVFR